MTSEGCPLEHPKTTSSDTDSRSTDCSIWYGSQSLNACMKCRANICRDFFFSALSRAFSYLCQSAFKTPSSPLSLKRTLGDGAAASLSAEEGEPPPPSPAPPPLPPPAPPPPARRAPTCGGDRRPPSRCSSPPIQGS